MSIWRGQSRLNFYGTHVFCRGGRWSGVVGAVWSSWSFRLVQILRFTFPCLDALLLHCQGSGNTMQLHIESAGVTYRLSLRVSTPQGCGGCVTVGTGETNATGGRQPPLGLDQRTIDTIHLMVQPTCIAQVVACTIPPPKRGGHCSAVDTFSAFREIVKKFYVGVSLGARSPPVLQVVQHGAVEWRSSPGSAHVLGDIGLVGVGVGGTDAPAVLLPSIAGNGQGAAVGNFSGGGCTDWGAGGEGEAGRHRLVRGARVVG